MVLQARIVLFSQGSRSNFVGFLLVMTPNPCKLCGVNNAPRSFHQNNTQACLEAQISGRLYLVWVYPVLGDLITEGHSAWPQMSHHVWWWIWWGRVEYKGGKSLGHHVSMIPLVVVWSMSFTMLLSYCIFYFLCFICCCLYLRLSLCDSHRIWHDIVH